MEHSEPLKFGHEPDGKSKRRISSILKAPRTSMKACGPDQDEQQEDTRPLEKRRISRRVSFATTNNVHVFAKDAKTESPVVAPIRNSSAVGVGDGQVKTMLHHDTAENQPITGLDTMLSMPFYMSQLNKTQESFFSDPVLKDECVDRTMLLGEDTGYMDMTQSHTITIDKEHGINTDFSFNVLENVSGRQSLKIQNGMPSNTACHVEKDAIQLDFNNFLASISKPGAHITASPLKKKTDLFGLEDAARVEMDKENILPTRLTKQTVHHLVNPQPKGLQPRISAASFLEEDHMDMTKSHTAVIDKKDIGQHDPYLVHGNHRSTGSITQLFSNDSDDMEITQSQTATINLKTMEKVNCSLPLNVDHNRSNFVSDDTSGMVMTQVFDGFLQEQIVTEGKVMTAFPKAHTMLSFNQPETRHMSEQNGVDHFQNNDSFTTVADADMELTESQTVALETKGVGEPVGKSRRVSYSVPSSRRESRRSVTSAEHTIFPSERSAFMELTCQTSTSVMSPGLDDMELTGCNYAAIDSGNSLAVSEVRKHASFMLPPSVSADTKQNHCVQSAVSVPHMEDDMEMTKCQAIIIESKSVGPKPFGKSNKRLSLMPASDIRSDINSKEDMKNAHERSGHTALNRFSLSELPDCMDIHEPSVFGISAVQDDMDLTGCRTVTIDTKNTSLASASRIMAQKTPCPSSSRCAVLDEDQMEMTEVVSEKPENVILSQTTCKSPIAVMDVEAGNLVDSHKEPWTHMDLTGSQAAVIDPNYSEVSCLSIVKKSSSVHLIAENAESSENDCDMEITGAFTAPFEQQCYVDFKKEDITKENAETLSGTTDQTTIKEGDVKKAVICEDFATESAFVVKKDQPKSAKSRRRSLADLKHKLQTIAHSINEPNGLLLGSHTAPIANFTVSERCPIDEHSERPSSTESLNGTPTLKNVSSANTERTAPFNLKNFLTARLSLGGATPKLPSRTKSASPNQTEPISNNKFENLFLETQPDGRIQSSSCVISMIDNEVLPEEDLSDTMVSYVSNKKHEHHDSTVVPLAEVAAEDVNLSQSEKIPCDMADAGDIKRQEASEKWGNNSAAAGVQNVSSIMSKMIDDTSSMTSGKCDGIAESSLRNSQFDSQIDGTTDHEFDFSKTLEDGSITVNEFLSHFGANTVIHKSRPSALPDNFRVATTHSMEDLLKEKYIFHSKQRVYEADTQKLSEMVEGFKTQLAEQYKALREINGTLLQDMCAFSNEQLQKFGAKLKERRVYFRKRSKQISHEMKHVLYSELIKTTQDSKLNLVTKIEETNEMLKDLDGCVNDLESDLAAVNSVLMGDQHCLIGAEPALKAKQKDLDALNSEVAETEKQICNQEHQRVALVSTQEKLQDEAVKLESCITTLNSLNEWRFCEQDENRSVFAFLHNTVHLEVKLKKTSEDAEQGVDVSFKFLLNGESSEPHADLIHRLLGCYIQTQTQWMQKYPTTQSVPVLLHDVSLVVSRLRLLGEEIHQLKKWGGLRLGILRITCVDTLIEILFSSVKAFAKFELSLAVTPDYPFSPLQLQKFQNHIGNARADQIKDILCSVTPSKNYLTKVIKKIHADILG